MEPQSPFPAETIVDWPDRQQTTLNTDLNHLQISAMIYNDQINIDPNNQELADDLSTTLESLCDTLLDIPEGDWLAIQTPAELAASAAIKYLQKRFYTFERIEGGGFLILTSLIPRSYISQAEVSLDPFPSVSLWVRDAFNPQAAHELKININNSSFGHQTADQVGDELSIEAVYRIQ